MVSCATSKTPPAGWPQQPASQPERTDFRFTFGICLVFLLVFPSRSPPRMERVLEALEVRRRSWITSCEPPRHSSDLCGGRDSIASLNNALHEVESSGCLSDHRSRPPQLCITDTLHREVYVAQKSHKCVLRWGLRQIWAFPRSPLSLCVLVLSCACVHASNSSGVPSRSCAHTSAFGYPAMLLPGASNHSVKHRSCYVLLLRRLFVGGIAERERRRCGTDEWGVLAAPRIHIPPRSILLSMTKAHVNVVFVG